MLFKRKRFGIVFLILLLLQGCSNGGDVSKIQIDYGQSSIYSREDMDSAIQKIKKNSKPGKEQSFFRCHIRMINGQKKNFLIVMN